MSDAFETDDDLQRLVLRKGEATAKGGHAFQRLLQLAETRNSGQTLRIARFIAATYNGEAFPFDLFELRTVDEAISDDMLPCLDALRWARPICTASCPTGRSGDRAVGPDVA